MVCTMATDAIFIVLVPTAHCWQAFVVVLAAVAVCAVAKNMWALPKMPVYLVDFSVHKGLEEWRFSKDMFIPLSRDTGVSFQPTYEAHRQQQQ